MNAVRVVGIQRHYVNHYPYFREPKLNIKTLTLQGAESFTHAYATNNHIRAHSMYSMLVISLASHSDKHICPPT